MLFGLLIVYLPASASYLLGTIVCRVGPIHLKAHAVPSLFPWEQKRPADILHLVSWSLQNYMLAPAPVYIPRRTTRMPSQTGILAGWLGMVQKREDVSLKSSLILLLYTVLLAIYWLYLFSRSFFMFFNISWGWKDHLSHLASSLDGNQLAHTSMRVFWGTCVWFGLNVVFTPYIRERSVSSPCCSLFSFHGVVFHLYFIKTSKMVSSSEVLAGLCFKFHHRVPLFLSLALSCDRGCLIQKWFLSIRRKKACQWSGCGIQNLRPTFGGLKSILWWNTQISLNYQTAGCPESMFLCLI